ncbi:3 beta-hydroxysteroid dehydrogenase type 7 isoform X2 [Narcine bancroftii]|uniref:3 beta-hydroxysteroid dehydrogenase type 7 isoform X2 n=1 Tax=Narcine bancroftii TaxID=1343680 RepID=UPI00383136B2
MPSAAQRDGIEARLVHLVTGGLGFLGRYLVRLLVQRGDNVAEVRVFDRAVDRELEALSTGTVNVLNACKELGIRYLLYTSSMEVVGPNKMRDPFLRGNEDTKYNSDVNGSYAQSKAAAEKLVLGANGSKIAGGKVLVTCSLRPTGIYGENNPIMEQIYRIVIRFGGRRLRLAGREIEHSRVYVGNVAWMHVLAARALHQDPALVGGEAYFCYDNSPYLSYEDFDQLLLEPVGLTLMGRRGPPVSYPVLRILVLAMEALRWLLRPFLLLCIPLNRDMLAVITTPFTVCTDKAGRHFGYRPMVSWWESKAHTVAWIKSLSLEG